MNSHSNEMGEVPGDIRERATWRLEKLGVPEELGALRPQLLPNDIARPVIKQWINSSDVLLKGDVFVPPETPLRSFEKRVRAFGCRGPLAHWSQMSR